MKFAVSALAIAAASLALASCASGGPSLSGGGADPMRYDAFYDGVDGPFYPGDWGGGRDLPYVNRVAHFPFSGVGLFGRGGGRERHGDPDHAH